MTFSQPVGADTTGLLSFPINHLVWTWRDMGIWEHSKTDGPVETMHIKGDKSNPQRSNSPCRSVMSLCWPWQDNVVDLEGSHVIFWQYRFFILFCSLSTLTSYNSRVSVVAGFDRSTSAKFFAKPDIYTYRPLFVRHEPSFYFLFLLVPFGRDTTT